MTTLTITLEAPQFSSSPGWTPRAVTRFIEDSLAAGCDLPGLVVKDAVIDE